ncbi:putative glycolipid-binding domain-containing protein [Pseudomonas sp. 5P_3.1_Bac2]|uniref:putative glycolipid-binding domain-containing protein n=1 Tax=Pseudomonas sp. 5P_3.1_Bac2 TaxID=2971617 RepID=UPI0021C72F6D|nr:putative glycolipid-binding domain-containing protein [Pseudomonas sp. 5P_3.1_Bac2]MCU1716401.1 putative glycolipid-binding domain-containing protein [Pseudomonas sp. 5P_3.1_Bac2]
MQQALVWKPWFNPGVENLRLSIDEQGITATSHLMQSLQGSSIAANYVLNFDANWRFHSLWIKVDNQGQRSLSLRRDEQGTWLPNERARPDLAACQQIFLSDSPFTHTPLLMRCGLSEGQSEVLPVAFVNLLTLGVEARQQRYQRRPQSNGQSHYRSETQGLRSTELSVDPQGLVIKASGQFMRISSQRLKLSVLV